MRNKANYKTEVRKQNTEDSKISAKSTPKLRFSVLTNFFYNCRGSSTNRAYFLQNKANFLKSQMNVNLYNTRDYEYKSNWTLGENKPNSKPNKANLPEGKIDAKCVFTKDYERNDIFAVPENKANSNPKQSQSKPSKANFRENECELLCSRVL